MKNSKLVIALILLLSSSLIFTNCGGDDMDPKMDETQIQFLLNGGMTPKELFDDNVPLDSLYGKLYEGGLIFYLDTNDGTGMVAATEDQTNFFDPGNEGEWGCFDTELSGANGTILGTGAQNTLDVLAGCTQGNIAAKLCADLVLNDKDDWFLPSKDELNLMYTNLVANGNIGGFMPFWTFYWSSTESDSVTAWHQSFEDGSQGAMYAKDNLADVRAARSF